VVAVAEQHHVAGRVVADPAIDNWEHRGDEHMTDADQSVDVVVVGAGMAGLAAAVQAQRAGADVLVCEKGPRAGGSMYLSAGIVYTYDSVEAIREAVPEGNPALQRLLVERKDESIAWLEDLGANTREPAGDMVFGSGKQLDPKPFTELMVDTVEDNGGAVLLETPMIALRAEAGRVAGVLAETADGDRLAVDADAVVLATGGFQGDETLLEQFVTDATENLWLRANPWSTGDGLRAASDVGAKTTGGMGTFYGHNLPAPPAEIPPEMLLDAKQAYGVEAVALDRTGRRYVDESASPYEVVLTQATAKRAGGRAYYVVDRELYESTFVSRQVSVSIETAAELGGRVAEAASLADLAATLREWDVDGERAVETLREFNAAVATDDGRWLDPPRRDNQTPIDEPPFHVVEVQPGITFTMGGIDVTEEMAVLRRAGTSSMLPHHPGDAAAVRMAPIPGLYAAGVDVGEVMRRRYVGGLCLALVTGRVAGRNAAEHETSSP
jgi:succinate dehydrogenase/fumarate reductase flavoprotein subunit